nr:hypothetical protein [Oceanococcus sp. HetDA_MAG_MS8]
MEGGRRSTAVVSDAGLELRVLSNRPDLISGGDALVEVVAAESESVHVTLNGADVSDQVRRQANGRIMGLVKDLKLGENRLKATADGAQAELVVINHPNFGPVFSAGQHRLKDWDICASGLPSELNDCNIEVSYRFFYKSSSPLATGLTEFDPEQGIPSDVAQTTTQTGETVPFIVRREDGFQDRDRYTIMVLYKLDEDWSAIEPQSQWNHKLLITHGGGCNMSFQPSSPVLSDVSGVTGFAPPPLEDTYVIALGEGFAVLSTALNNNGHNCDHVLQAESMMMAKERLVEQYGELRYTIGTGCSGGAITQQTVANAYPGIYQGLLTTCAYPDSVSPAVQFYDNHLMRQYFEFPARWGQGVIWSPHQFGLVEGHITHLNAVVGDDGLFLPAVTTSGNCAGDATYHPTNNPQGVRCGAIEWYKHIWGTQWVDAKSADEQIEVTKIPVGNEGIQYGLELLKIGQITPGQFVDLNLKIGGLDFDMLPQVQRSRSSDGAISAAFRGGAGNVANNLDTVAIINFFGPDPGAAHDTVHAWWTRWRLDREFGHHDNHVMWGGPILIFGDPFYFEQSFYAMDRWLTAVEADVSGSPLSERIIANKPTDVHDQCSNGLGLKVADEICVELLRTPFAYGTARTVAGADHLATNYDCQLKPFSRDDDYGLIPFTEDQWQQLEALFANGVCDYEQPGLGETTKTVPWLTYQLDDGRIATGGLELPAATYPAGWGSPAFSDMWN